MAYRKRVKMTKLNSFEETLKMCCDQAKRELGRELTQREVKYLKKWIYRKRKKLMKGYMSMPAIMIDTLTEKFNQLYDSMIDS